MKALEIQVDANGLLKLPLGVSLPSHARLAILVLDPSAGRSDELSGPLISGMAEQSRAFDFLNEEPEIYSDRDILPGRVNPHFRK